MIFWTDLPDDFTPSPPPCVCGSDRIGSRCYCDDLVDGTFTFRELSDAFDWVKPSTHWKDPIRTFIHPRDRKVTASAVTWFTGSVATFTPEPDGLLRVEAAGYYRTIGA